MFVSHNSYCNKVLRLSNYFKINPVLNTPIKIGLHQDKKRKQK